VATAQPDDSAPFTPTADDLVGANTDFADSFSDHDRPADPARRMAVVTCMDARLDVLALLGLAVGEAHVIRNAGGVITDDVIRSLCLSQRYLGTREIVLVHHTDCGLQKVTDDEVSSEIEAEVGVRPPWAVQSFDDPYVDVRESMHMLAASPFISYAEHIRGFVYEVQTGRIAEVAAGQG